MPRKFAISDIHGCNRAFGELLDKIAFSKSDELYLLGDYIDRGPDSKGVIQCIMDMQAEGYTVRCLRGNHEQMYLDAFKDTSNLRIWRDNGGTKMLLSYDALSARDIPREHYDFMNNLEWYFKVDNYILVHAGLDFNSPEFPFDNKDILIWIRAWHNNIDYGWLGDRYIVHGHTPQKRDEIEAQLTKLPEKRWLDIDAGCFMNPELKLGYGHLCAFDMTNQELIFCENSAFLST
jgi:serine/threonine protein phosphatase 1